MRKFWKRFFPAKVKYSNVDTFCVSGLSRWRLTTYLSKIPGVVFTRRPALLGSSALPLAKFDFKCVAFQIDEGGDLGGDGLWVAPIAGRSHPTELHELREQLKDVISKHEDDA